MQSNSALNTCASPLHLLRHIYSIRPKGKCPTPLNFYLLVFTITKETIFAIQSRILRGMHFAVFLLRKFQVQPLRGVVGYATVSSSLLISLVLVGPPLYLVVEPWSSLICMTSDLFKKHIRPVSEQKKMSEAKKRRNPNLPTRPFPFPTATMALKARTFPFASPCEMRRT